VCVALLEQIELLFEQIELQAKLLNYFLGSNKSNINQTLLDSDTFRGICLEISTFINCTFTHTFAGGCRRFGVVARTRQSNDATAGMCEWVLCVCACVCAFVRVCV